MHIPKSILIEFKRGKDKRKRKKRSKFRILDLEKMKRVGKGRKIGARVGANIGAYSGYALGGIKGAVVATKQGFNRPAKNLRQRGKNAYRYGKAGASIGSKIGAVEGALYGAYKGAKLGGNIVASRL